MGIEKEIEMNLHQIKTAIEEGQKVFWTSYAYQVIKDKRGQYFINCLHNNYCVGLTHMDGVTMNGREDEFFIGDR